MNFLLSGAEFNNKGAEAMTLVALKNIYENDTDANVFLFDVGTRPSFKLKKKISYLYVPEWYVRKLNCGKKIGCYKQRVKDFIKFFIPFKKSAFGTFQKIKKELQSIDVVIDISGFAFSSKWGDVASLEWLSKIDLMGKMGAKIYLMPQSFGPFDFKNNYVLEYGKKVLSKCEHIYAREENGFILLKNLGLNNISLKSDSVLTSEVFDTNVLIKSYNKNDVKLTVKKGNNIAIIPNARLIDKGGMSRNVLLNFYTQIIDKYKKEFDFYLIAHAGEDLVLCNLLKDKYSEDEKVILINRVLPSFKYEQFISNMSFIIASRFHAIVHAYREGIPAVVLGWADKYKGLVSDVNQTDYLIDLDHYEQALLIINDMTERYKTEATVLKSKVKDIQKENCYNFLSNLGNT